MGQGEKIELEKGKAKAPGQGHVTKPLSSFAKLF
jgi:hypothetical protein